MQSHTLKLREANYADTDGEVAFRQHSGGHTDAPNWPTFLTFAERYLHVTRPQ